MHQLNSLKINTSEIQELTEIPYSQINEIDSDYTGIIGFCGVILFLGILTAIITCYWTNKFFKHRQHIENVRLRNECIASEDLNKKLDSLLEVQKDLVEGIKKCN